jgi:DnaK suppressor protein
MLDTTKFTERLNADLLRITSDLSTIATYDATTDNWEAVPSGGDTAEADDNVEADGVEEWNERRATVATLEIEYKDIKRAHGKLLDGTFGYCEVCGSAIATERLEFKPTARTCTEHINDEASLALN